MSASCRPLIEALREFVRTSLSESGLELTVQALRDDLLDDLVVVGGCAVEARRPPIGVELLLFEAQQGDQHTREATIDGALARTASPRAPRRTDRRSRGSARSARSGRDPADEPN